MGKKTELNSDVILFDFEIYVFNMFMLKCTGPVKQFWRYQEKEKQRKTN